MTPSLLCGKDFMKAFVLDRYGSKIALRVAEIPDPEMTEDDVLVQVHAAGVNPLDAKIRSGEFKLILPYRTPFVLGHDVAGVVVRVGTRVKHFKVGDEVYARPADRRIGSFAELIAVQEKDLALKPKRLTMEEAASIPLVGLTAWQALVERGQLQPGQKVFIQAGSGGVGTFAIQLAKHLGATVATTTSATHIDLVRSLGASFAFLFMKASGDQLREIAVLIDAGAIRPVVDKVFPFQSTNEALAYVEAGRAKGKVVIRVIPDPVSTVAPPESRS